MNIGCTTGIRTYWSNSSMPYSSISCWISVWEESGNSLLNHKEYSQLTVFLMSSESEWISRESFLITQKWVGQWAKDARCSGRKWRSGQMYSRNREHLDIIHRVWDERRKKKRNLVRVQPLMSGYGEFVGKCEGRTEKRKFGKTYGNKTWWVVTWFRKISKSKE